MTNPMTAEEARILAHVGRQYDIEPVAVGVRNQINVPELLDQLADMLDRQAVDREAIDEIVCEAYYEGVSVGKNDSNVFSFGELTNRILALMPAGGAKAERERLAKAAEGDDVYLTTGERADAWIRAQGEAE